MRFPSLVALVVLAGFAPAAGAQDGATTWNESGVAALQAGQALIETARDGRQLAEDLEPFTDAGFFEAMGPETLARFDSVNAGLQAIGVAGKGTALTFAGEFSPEIQRATVLVTAIALAIGDASGEIVGLVRTAGSASSVIGDFVQSFGPIARANFAILSFGLSEVTVQAGEFADGLEDGEGIAGDYVSQAEALIATQGRVGKAFKRSEKDVTRFKNSVRDLTPEEKAAAANQDLIELIGGYEQAHETAGDAALRRYSDELDRIAELEAVGQDAYLADRARSEAKLALDKAVADQGVAALDATKAALEETASIFDEFFQTQQDAIIGGVTDTLGGVADLAGTLSDQIAEKGGEGAIALFRTSQAAAIGEATILGIVAAQRALATLGPIAGPIAAVGIGATTAANVAAIASQAPPQGERHMGGMGGMGGGQLAGSPTMAPDERSTPSGARVLNQEATISTAGVGAIVNALNAGRTPGGGLRRVRAVVGKGSLDRENERSIRGGTSRFARENKRQSIAAVRASEREW